MKDDKFYYKVFFFDYMYNLFSKRSYFMYN